MKQETKDLICAIISALFLIGIMVAPILVVKLGYDYQIEIRK